jgi:hypothetical protein
MRPEIIIEFRLNPLAESRFVAIPVDEFLVREVSAPIDFPSVAALASDSMAVSFVVHNICTPPEEIARRLKQRADVEQLIARHIAATIHQELAGRDTEMGYKKRRAHPTPAEPR